MLAALLGLLIAGVQSVDPLAFFHPAVVLDASDRRSLEDGEPITRVLRGEGHQVAVFAAIPVAIDGDRLVAWTRRIEALKRSSYVLAIHRFSDPPRLEDLSELVLDDDDLSAIRRCRPGDCGLKLSADEMAVLRAASDGAGVEWKAAVQEAFRRVVLRRVDDYLAGRPQAPYEDKDVPVEPREHFAAILEPLSFLSAHAPHLPEVLRREPPGGPGEKTVESFLYWSKERLSGKPIVSVTDVRIVRGRAGGDLPDALVAGKQIFATHYVNASLGLTALVAGAPGQPNYLAYLNRSEVDVLGGFFGGIIRSVMQRRMKGEAADTLRALRERLEGGLPPAADEPPPS
jgi:hypothetical protein